MTNPASPPGYSPKRKAGRLRLRLPAHAILHAATLRVILCDLSEGGAKIFSSAAFPRGHDLILRWGKQEAFGQIVWERDGMRGIEFEEPLPASVLIAARGLQDAGGMSRDEIAEWLAEKGWSFGKALS